MYHQKHFQNKGKYSSQFKGNFEMTINSSEKVTYFMTCCSKIRYKGSHLGTGTDTALWEYHRLTQNDDGCYWAAAKRGWQLTKCDPQFSESKLTYRTLNSATLRRTLVQSKNILPRWLTCPTIPLNTSYKILKMLIKQINNLYILESSVQQ